MAEAMIPPEMRSSTNLQQEKPIELKSSLNLISDSPKRLKRKKSNNNVVIAISAEIKRHKMAQLCDGRKVKLIVDGKKSVVNIAFESKFLILHLKKL